MHPENSKKRAVGKFSSGMEKVRIGMRKKKTKIYSWLSTWR